MRDYFTTLNDSECNYAVLRNYELLPDDFENDIDILVSEKDFKLACFLTKKYVFQKNVFCHNLTSYET